MANDGLLRVNFGDLSQATADITVALNTLRADLDELESKGNRLTADWSGTAKQAYADRQAAWTAASQSLTNILQGIRDAVERSGDDYLATEKQATQRFQ